MKIKTVSREQLFIICLLLFAFLNTISFAAQPDAEETLLAFRPAGGGLELEFDLPEAQWNVSKNGSDVLILEGASVLADAGGPQLPCYQQIVAIPDGMDLCVGDVSVEWSAPELRTFAHDAGDETDIVAKNDALYQSMINEPAPVVDVVSCGRWRDLRIAYVVVNPVRMESETTVRLAEHISAEFSYVSAVDDVYDPEGVSEAMLPLYKAFVPNALDVLDETDVARGSILYIVPSQLESTLRTLIKWRKQCGYHVIVKNTEDANGTETGDFRALIDDVYTTANPPLDYVVLVGDTDAPTSIPTYMISGGAEVPVATDQKYVTVSERALDFADALPRCHIGRLSVDSMDDLRTVIAKILRYERQPLMADHNCWNSSVLISDASQASSIIDMQEWLRQKMVANGFTSVEHLLMRDIGDFITPNELNDIIDRGVSWVAYRGFGAYDYWTGFFSNYNTSDIYDLDNGSNLPVITSMVCGGGAFEKLDENFGEAWIRAGSASAMKGGVAFIGPSEVDTHTRWNNIMLSGWYEGLFDKNLRTMGQCMLGAKLAMARAYPANWNPEGLNTCSVWFYFHTYNIIGDPVLQLRAESPRQFAIEHVNALHTGDNRLMVRVKDDEGTPVEGASVVLTGFLDGEIVAKTFSDRSGNALLTFDQLPGGNLKLSVMRPDFIPELDNIPHLEPHGFELTSAGLTEDNETSNGDGRINPGETVDVALGFTVLEPEGLSEASIELALVNRRQGRVISARDELQALANGAVVRSNACRIELASDLAAGEPIELCVGVYDGDELIQTLYANAGAISAPVLSVKGITFSGEALPGTTVDLRLKLENDNDAENASALTGTLSILDTKILVQDATCQWPAINAGEIVEPSDQFTIQIADDIYPGRTFECVLNLVAEDGVETELQFQCEVAGASPNTPTGPFGSAYYIFENVDGNSEFVPDYNADEITDISNATYCTELEDIVENYHSDRVHTYELPFTFTYWGMEYDHISICSNGWAAFETSTIPFFVNRPLPAPLTPRGAVFALWDDFTCFGDGTNGVFTRHDEENGYFIIVWKDVVREFNPSASTFALVLHDPSVHGLHGGQGMFGLVYDNVANTDVRENYCTVGMTSPDGKHGMTYEFANQHPETTVGVGDDLQLRVVAMDDPNVDVRSKGEDLPQAFALERVYPNPFNARMTVRFALPEASDVELRVFNMLGQRVAARALQSVAAGRHSVSFDAANWSSGIYFVQWKAGKTIATRKAVLVK